METYAFNTSELLSLQIREEHFEIFLIFEIFNDNDQFNER